MKSGCDTGARLTERVNQHEKVLEDGREQFRDIQEKLGGLEVDNAEVKIVLAGFSGEFKKLNGAKKERNRLSIALLVAIITAAAAVAVAFIEKG